MMVVTQEKELGAALKSRRERARLTQGELAERAGVSRSFVIGLERGLRPRAELVRVFAVIKALDAAVTLVDHRSQTPEDALAELLGDL
ncbi:helix-turn-helix transcriptional regulator [Quadrisphaera setariae]|nr:helix-turn-helix domain-containing protein [Quadrisphaera setariae]